MGRVLRWHRSRAGLSRRALSALSGVSETAIYDAEAGKPTMQLRTLLALADVLNLELRLDGPLMAAYEQVRAAPGAEDEGGGHA